MGYASYTEDINDRRLEGLQARQWLEHQYAPPARVTAKANAVLAADHYRAAISAKAGFPARAASRADYCRAGTSADAHDVRRRKVA
jgi:hypothetical protein